MTISRLNNSGDLMDGGLPYRMTDQPAAGWAWLDERSIVGPYLKKYFRGNGREGQTLNDKYVCFIFPAIEPELGGFPFVPWLETDWANSRFMGNSTHHDGTDQNLGQEFKVIREGKMDILLIGGGGWGGGSQHTATTYSGGGGGAGQFMQVDGYEATSDVYKTIVATGGTRPNWYTQSLDMRGRGGDSVLQRKKIFAGLRAGYGVDSPQFLDKVGVPVFTAWGGGHGGVGNTRSYVEHMTTGASGGGMNTCGEYIFRDQPSVCIEEGVTGYPGGPSSYTTQGAGGGGGMSGPGETGYRYTEPRAEGSDWQTPLETDPKNDRNRGGDGGPGVTFNFWGEEQEACAGGGGGCYAGTKGMGGTPGAGGNGASGSASQGQAAGSWGSGGGGAGHAGADQVGYGSTGGQGIVAVRYKLEELA